ncbi:hypothetical protein FOA43_002574 [Brettanomyces nanus]|uniref:Mitochondrial carrier n=1 Tax=Eeniella nana TaxID=13502 RepID=A0A875S7U4_EENNA|nr:uncharacterized protein FOA43_002574 [Brettanomyces nanus]QPG75224.1 hypothetical protein FOA43_002574 [Brettanomyces nanus]
MSSPRKKRTVAVDAAREIITGSLSGALGKVFEFPFDTIKVRMQYSQSLPTPLFGSSWECIVRSYRKDGFFKGFYRGLVPPMFGAALEISTLFFSYNMAQDFIKLSRGSKLSDELSVFDKLLCGAWGGVCTSFLLTPVELLKCRFQVETLGSKKTSVPKIVRSVIKNNGLLGLWKGETTTSIREAGGSMAWFGNYEAVLRHFAKGDPDYHPKPWQSMLAGSLAGVGYHCTMFPVDTVKSIYQIDERGKRSLMGIVKQIYNQKGIFGFYTGLGVTLCKSIPASAVLFVSYEYIKRSLPF